MKISLCLAVLLSISSSSAHAGILDFFGLGKKNKFQEEFAAQKLETLGRISYADGAPLAHGTASMIQGRLAIIFAPDSGVHGGGFSFFDLNLSDPKKPRVKLVHQEKNEAIREGHGYGFTMQGGSTFVALQTVHGVQFWDWTNLEKPRLVKDLVLPGIEESDYDLGAWWVFYQAPYVYVGGSGNGLYVIDAHERENPKLVARVAPEKFKLSRLGSVFAVGNLLVTTMNDGPGASTIDISDPEHPRLIDSYPNVPVYSSLFNGGKILVAGQDSKFYSLNVSPQGLISADAKVSVGDKGGYVSFQDGFAHVGASKQYVKVDVREPGVAKVAAWGSSGVFHRDEDFANVIGPYVLISDDHGNGSYWVRHQAAPDTTGPSVNMVSPFAGATAQALTSRVGLTFTDQIDLSSVNEKTLIVRPIGGAPLAGFFSSQSNIVNFSPAKQLLPSQEYEVEVVAGGIRDYTGNTTPGFKSRFRTDKGEQAQNLRVAGGAAGLVNGEAVFSVTGGQPGELYSWDLGDGHGYGAPSPSSTVKAHFAKPGHYLVSVRGKDLAGSDAFLFTAHSALTANKPARSSSIIADEKSGLLFNINPDQGTVTATSLKDFTVAWEMPTGQDPRSLTLDRRGRLWVANSREGSVSVLDALSGKQLQKITLPFGSAPFGIAADPVQDFVHVTLAARGELAILDGANFSVARVIPVGLQPRGIAISADGKFALVSRFISPDARGEVYRVDLESGKVSVIGLAIDQTPDTESSGRGLPNYLGFLAISPDGLSAWVPSKKDNILRGLKRDGLVPTFESTVRAIVSQIDLVQGRETLGLRNDFNDRDMPVAVDYSPLGDYLFVAVQGSNTVEILDAYSGQKITGLEKVGLAPQGLVVSEDGKRIYVHSFLSRQILAYDISAFDHPVKIAETTVVSHEALSADVLLGKQIFYNSKDRRMSRDAYISCASCHQDGGQDGRTWDFTDRGEGLRNTITMRGHAGMGQGHIHWTGNFDEIQDFENDIRNNFGGTGFLSDADFAATQDALGAPKAGLSRELDALSAYVTSLTEPERSPYRNADGSLAPDAVKGEKIFARLQCAACHSGPSFTDSGSGVLHNVGTISALSGQRRGEALTGFDTPSLLGAWATAPYLHDGSAATLRDVLQRAGSLHGKAQGLSREETDQLLLYLLSL